MEARRDVIQLAWVSLHCCGAEPARVALMTSSCGSQGYATLPASLVNLSYRLWRQQESVSTAVRPGTWAHLAGEYSGSPANSFLLRSFNALDGVVSSDVGPLFGSTSKKVRIGPKLASSQLWLSTSLETNLTLNEDLVGNKRYT